MAADIDVYLVDGESNDDDFMDENLNLKYHEVDFKKQKPLDSGLNIRFFMSCLSGATALKIYGSILGIAALALAGLVSFGLCPAAMVLASTAAAVAGIGFFYCAGKAERPDILEDLNAHLKFG